MNTGKGAGEGELSNPSLLGIDDGYDSIITHHSGIFFFFFFYFLSFFLNIFQGRSQTLS